MASPWSVAAGADDGYYSPAAGDFNNTGTTIIAGVASAFPYHAFIRFDNVDIPAGSTIVWAYLKMTRGGAVGGANFTFKIRAEAADDPAAPTSHGDADGRAKTTAGVDWDPLYNEFNNSGTQLTPNLASVIQEVVDRGGWASGNAINMFILHDGAASGTNYAQPHAFEDGGTTEPELHVYYAPDTAYLEAVPVANADDGYWYAGDSSFSNSANDNHVGDNGGAFNTYVRFDNLALEQGAVIVAAFFEAFASTGNGSTGVLTKITANDVDDAANPTGYADANSKVSTTAAVDWDVGTWVSSGDRLSPDISSVIQEVVDRGGWASGNALMILWKNDGSPTGTIGSGARENTNYPECRLHIIYELPGGGAVFGWGPIPI